MVRGDKARVREGMRKGLKLEAKVRATVVGRGASGDLNAFLVLVKEKVSWMPCFLLSWPCLLLCLLLLFPFCCLYVEKKSE